MGWLAARWSAQEHNLIHVCGTCSAGLCTMRKRANCERATASAVSLCLFYLQRVHKCIARHDVSWTILLLATGELLAELHALDRWVSLSDQVRCDQRRVAGRHCGTPMLPFLDGRDMATCSHRWLS